MRGLTIVVQVDGSSQGLSHLVASLDLQTAGTDDFDVVWALGRDDDVPERVESWLRLRPHHRLARGGIAAALAAGEGTYALVVGPGDQFYADAVERLLAFAEAHALDALLARTALTGSPVPPELWHDATDLRELPAVAAEFPAPVSMVRRESAQPAAESQLRPPAGQACGVLASVPVLRRAGAVEPDEPLRTLSAGWDDAELVLELRRDELFGPAVALIQACDDARTYLLPVTLDHDADPVAVVRFDPLDLPEVHLPLGPGGWLLSVQGTSASGEASVRPVGWRDCSPALVGTTGLVPFAAREGWALDVGPTRQRLLTVEDASAGAVTETPYGSELVVSLAGLHTAQAGDVDGFMSLDSLTIPARIVVDGAGARLEAMATGVRGVKPIAVHFGPGRPQPLGLSLVISEVGNMSFVETPRPVAPTPRATPSQPRPKPKPAPRRGLLADMRRRVPSRVEPLVRAAAGWSPARRLYRRLTR